MGCGKSKLNNAVATGNTTASRNGSKRVTSVESSVTKSSSKKLKPQQSMKRVDVEKSAEKVPKSIQNKNVCPQPAPKADKGKEEQGQGKGIVDDGSEDSVGVVPEVEAITTDGPEPKEGEVKEETRRDEEARGEANGEEETDQGSSNHSSGVEVEAIPKDDPEPKDEGEGNGEEETGQDSSKHSPVMEVEAITKGNPEPKEEGQKGETGRAEEAANGEEGIGQDSLNHFTGVEEEAISKDDPKPKEETSRAEEAADGVEETGRDSPNHFSGGVADDGNGSEGQLEHKKEAGTEEIRVEIGDAPEGIVEASIEETEEENSTKEAEEEAEAGESKDPTPVEEKEVISATEEKPIDRLKEDLVA